MHGRQKYEGRGGVPELRETRRELNKLKQKRSDRLLMIFIIIGPIALYFAYELGRSVYYMQDVKSFVSTLDHRPPAEVKSDLNRYVPLLNDRNAFVRDGMIAAFKAATGWNPGTDGNEWRRMWQAHEASWEYHPYKPLAPAPAVAPWVAELPPAALQSSTPPATVTTPPAP